MTTDRTIDGTEITLGLRVWDYDLRRGTVTEPPSEWNPGWWHVTPDGSTGTKIFDGGRLWTRHPSTGELA